MTTDKTKRVLEGAYADQFRNRAFEDTGPDNVSSRIVLVTADRPLNSLHVALVTDLGREFKFSDDPFPVNNFEH